MLKLLIIITMLLLVTNPQSEEIYIGKSFPWTIYYDSSKVQPVVEIGGVKYGRLDFLEKINDSISQSSEGKLFVKECDLYYKNEVLDIIVLLNKKKYTNKIDKERLKIFKINAFVEISKLKDSLRGEESYQFNWQVEDDFIFFRDNSSFPKNYIPNYKKSFYKSLK